MKNLIFTLVVFLLIFDQAQSQVSTVKVPSYYVQQKSFTESLEKIIKEVNLNGTYDAGDDGMEKISFAVIDLSASDR